MKKFIYFLPLFLLATSCTKELGELAGFEEPRLVVNSLIAAGDDNQKVFFHQTGKTGTSTIYHTQFEIRANDKVIYNSKSDPLMGDHNDFTFSANDIKPGDVVSIFAKNGGLQASAEVEVPQPVIITGLDTMTVMAKRYSYNKDLSPHTRYLVHLRLPSDTQKNEMKFFRVQVYKNVYTFQMAEGFGNEITNIVYALDGDHSHFSYSQDAALTENESAIFNEDSAIEIDWLESDLNEYRIFRSAYFKDGEYTLYLDLPQFNEYQFGWYQDVKIRVYSISHLEYNYLQALTSFKDYDPEVITEGEPIMPSNIVGGAGIFCVESFADVAFHEDHKTYELVDGKYVRK